MKQELKVIVIGAGTGGLCLAHGLKRAGISVQVFERDRTRRDGLQGYRVGISPMGSYALQQCLPPELFQLFLDTCARAPRYFNMLDENLRELLSLDVQDSGDPVDSEKSVSRMTLRQVLLTGLEQEVAFDKTFTHYETQKDGSVTAFFEDGSSVQGDVLVAADGARSRVRKQRLPNAKMQETGIVSIGGKVPLTEETRRLLSEKVFHGVSLVLAPRGMGAILHVMEFPWRHAGVRHEAGESDTALLQQWPGLLYDNTTDHIIWGVWAARQNFTRDPLEASQTEKLQIAAAMTAHWSNDFRTLLNLTDRTTVFTINVRTSVPPQSWQSDQVTLLGDAVHTMTPGRGVGANTALRDAMVLCRKLTNVSNGDSDLVDAIHAYEGEMLQYSSKAVIASRKQMDASNLVHKPVIGDAALAATRTALRMVNKSAALKKRMTDSQAKLRSIEASEVRDPVRSR